MRLVAIALLVFCGIGCSGKSVVLINKEVISVTGEDGQLLKGQVAISKDFILYLEDSFTLYWPEMIQEGQYYLKGPNMALFITVSKTDAQDRENHRVAIERLEKPERYLRGAIEYLGSYTSRVSLDDNNQGFNGIVFKGDNQLDMEFSFSKPEFLDEARKIWMSVR